MFSLGIRKTFVITAIAAVFLLANAWMLVSWLGDHGIIEWAGWFKSRFLTGTAITVVAAMLILYVKPRASVKSFISQCPVCDSKIFGRKNYCPDCGSKL